MHWCCTLKCSLIASCCGHTHVLCFTLLWDGGFISQYALKRFEHKDRVSLFYNQECSVGFSGFWGFFFLASTMLYLSKSEGAEKLFFFIRQQMAGIMTSSVCICLDVSRIYSSIINLSILGHQISVQNFFLALSSSVRNTTDPSRNETFCLLYHLQLPPAGLSNTALAQLCFPQAPFKWFMFYVKVSGFHWIQWATL